MIRRGPEMSDLEEEASEVLGYVTTPAGACYELLSGYVWRVTWARWVRQVR